jgi:hypothetical protein
MVGYGKFWTNLSFNRALGIKQNSRMILGRKKQPA